MSECRHRWFVCIKNEIAEFSKRDDGKTPDIYYAMGDVKGCSACPTLFFFPHNKEMYPVEIEVFVADEECAA